MTEAETFYLFDIIPRPKERPRMAAGQRPFTSKASREYEAEIKRITSDQHPVEQPWTGDLQVEMKFYLGSKVHGDIDNLAKSIMDAMQGVAFANDKQIKRLDLQIYYLEKNSDVSPFTRVKIAHSMEKAS